MHVILNSEPLEEVDCFNYLGSQVTADGGCERDVVHRMNEGYRAWGVLKSMLINRELWIKAKKCLYECYFDLCAVRLCVCPSCVCVQFISLHDAIVKITEITVIVNVYLQELCYILLVMNLWGITVKCMVYVGSLYLYGGPTSVTEKVRLILVLLYSYSTTISLTVSVTFKFY